MLAYGQRPNGICTIKQYVYICYIWLEENYEYTWRKRKHSEMEKSMNNSQELSYIQIHNNVIYV